MTTQTTPKPRGFQCLTPERLREIAIRGGKSVAAENRAFSKDRSLAARAGKVGGSVKKEPDQ